MKFRLTFKTPDVVDQIDQKDATDETLVVLDKFLKFGEQITVEFDTETQTAVAVAVRRS